jgi:tetratricopeptide (TPR) repeat protein
MALAEEAFRAAIAVAQAQKARSFELESALSLAKLYQSTARPAEAHAILASALDGFSPTPEMPQIAAAQGLLAELVKSDEVQVETARRERHLDLRVAYGNALIAARGYGAAETTQAFIKAHESATGERHAPARLAADYGLWVGSYVRGELSSMRTHAAAFLSHLKGQPDLPEECVAHRAAGITHWFAGEFHQAREHLERALALFVPGRDDDLAFRFGQDAGVSALLNLAFALWPLGDVARAISLIERAHERLANITHAGTLGLGSQQSALFELMRHDRTRMAQNAYKLARLAREHDLPMFRAFALFLKGLAKEDDTSTGGLEDMRRGVDLLREQNVLLHDGLLKIALAEAEARAGDRDRAVATLDEALATSDRAGYRTYEAELHRVRGELLLKREPDHHTLGEEAFKTAIAIARRQGARSFELRAALSLAKLYQSTARPAEVHAVLTPALEGFSPTPEMPEIAEAQALLAALAETEDVKAAETQRQRRLHLQTAYGQAMMWAKGFSAEETRASFSRATELTAKTDSFADRFAAGHFQWSLAYLRGELRSARELELSFLKEAEDTGRIVEAGVARRGLALACYQVADFLEARIHCERALEICDAECDRETQKRFPDATGPVVLSVLAVTMWQLGEVESARELIDQATRRGSELGGGPSMGHPLWWKSQLEILRGDPVAALIAAEALEGLGREHGLPFWRALGELDAGWARGRLHDAAVRPEDLRRTLAAYTDQHAKFDAWFLTGLLAELEAETLGAETALARIDEAMALARQVEARCNLPFLHLLRGKLLLERDPSNPAPAEEAFQNALGIAREQGARSWGLRAALSLAKLYQSTARPVEAQAVLAPALEGFSPTPEMPEIAEAQAVLAALENSDEVKASVDLHQRRAHLQTMLAHAVGWSEGFAAHETEAALTRAADIASEYGSFSDRMVAAQGRWNYAISRGELRAARQLAFEALRQAEKADRRMEAGVARRGLALIHFFGGEFLEARNECERALADFDPERDKEVRERFGDDIGTVVMSILAVTSWQLGEVERAHELIDAATRRAIDLEHEVSKTTSLLWRSLLNVLRGDPAATLAASEGLEGHGRDQGMAFWRVLDEMQSGWARGRLGDHAAGAAQLQTALAAYMDRGERVNTRFFQGLLAEIEAETLGTEAALARIDEALDDADRVEYRWDLAFVHRLRGELLLKRDPSITTPAEEAFQTAIEVATQQGGRSLRLQAALGLANLYQSTARPADAREVLAPALEGFSPTPEMREIAEAKTLLAALVETERQGDD